MLGIFYSFSFICVLSMSHTIPHKKHYIVYYINVYIRNFTWYTQSHTHKKDAANKPTENRERTLRTFMLLQMTVMQKSMW